MDLVLPEAAKEVDAEVHETEDMSACETIFNLSNTMVGGGVLSVPFAFRLISYSAALLLALVVLVTAFTACLIGQSLDAVRHKTDTPPACRDYAWLAEVSFGPWGRRVVGITTAMELWIAAVTFLVMSGNNAKGLLGVNEFHAVMFCTVLSTVMVFIPLRVYAYVSLVSLIALLIASLAFLADLLAMPSWSMPDFVQPQIADLFRAYGLFIFCFAGHPCFPGLHQTMRQTKHWTSCVSLSFSIASCYYVGLGLIAFMALGTDVHPVFTADMRDGWMGRITIAFFAVKIQLTTPVLLRVVIVALQLWPEGGGGSGEPRGEHTVRSLLGSYLPAAVLVVFTGASACFLSQKVAALASLAGALLVNLTSVVLPAVMYARLVWSDKTSKAKLALCALLVAFGLVTAVVGTVLAVQDMSKKAHA
ncbi:unnamed protein product [Effrenium voratum]|uniref:Amino acid transporter transmembrane domain-containing protein n=1 Tax=Effrenium voratum TaxID=2562239 RepID=A0AA36MS51_9DINO|nr:unnamed protein product [Effrenium voratum]